MSSRREQCNIYQGLPLRAWIKVMLVAEDDSTEGIVTMVDTGCPYPIIIGEDRMLPFARRIGTEVSTNFGLLQSHWVRVQIPELGFDEDILGFTSNTVVKSVKSSSDDFEGLIGLPFLRLLDYGGDEGAFWIRPASTTP